MQGATTPVSNTSGTDRMLVIPAPRTTTPGPSLAIGLALAVLAALLLPAVASAQTSPTIDTFEIVLSDGTEIHVCRIAPAELTTHPVVLEWTNYNIDSEATGPAAGCPPQFGRLADLLVADGYVFIAGQTRGVGRSTGQPDIWSTQDGRDGAEVVEWLATQPWSTGAVGIVGCSSSAMEGLQVAVQAPPSLAAAAFGCFAVDAYRGAYFPGGLRAYSAFTFIARLGPDVEPGAAIQLATQGNLDPFQRVVTDGLVAAESVVSTEDGPFWQDKSTAFRLGDIAAPVYAFGNWTDFFGRGATEWARDAMGPDDRLLYTPGWHGDSLLVTGPYGMNERSKAWFDHHLRDRPLPFADEDPVVYWELEGGFTAGTDLADLDGRFRSASSWPLPGTTWERWYLRGEPSGTSTSINDGALSLRPPTSDEGSASFVTPAPSAGTTTDPRGFGQPSRNGPDAEDAGVLTWTSEPLEETRHIAGTLTVTLQASSTAVDTDWYVRLLSVAPDGSFQDVTNGWLKGAHRALDPDLTLRNAAGDITRPYHTHAARDLLTPGTVETFDIELWPTATEIPAGHRLRLWVASTDTPWFLHDTGPAVNTVVHSDAQVSSLLLPLAPAAPAPESTVDTPAAEPAPAGPLPTTGGGLALAGGLTLAAAGLRSRGGRARRRPRTSRRTSR